MGDLGPQKSDRLALLAEVFSASGTGLRGIEREALRMEHSGHLARTRHPRGLGSTLTHPHITTDYAEALIELITPAERDAAQTLTRLDQLHAETFRELGDEWLWSQSMPCALPEEKDIEIAWYGTSHMGMLKHVYRRGLAVRYGKSMQCIAGIHYNYSLPEALWERLRIEEGSALSERDFQSGQYLALIRNFRRYSWLLMYLFGASPVVSRCFLHGREHPLQSLSEHTLYLPYATSLRMSGLGYQNDAQAGLTPHENSLDDYIAGLLRAVNTPYPPYETFGTKQDGEWMQINTNLLQIENEYYSIIRPKRVIRSGERPIQALCSRGVQYIEVRCMDVDPFEPTGISLPTARFLDVFLLYCAMTTSPLTCQTEINENDHNFAMTVTEGRRPGLQLQQGGQEISLRTWGDELLTAMRPYAEMLDALRGDSAHGDALTAQAEKLADPGKTPSARVLATMHEHGNSFLKFGLAQSQKHAGYFADFPLSPEQRETFAQMATTSLAEQHDLELHNQGSFDDFVAAYRASRLCE